MNSAPHLPASGPQATACASTPPGRVLAVYGSLRPGTAQWPDFVAFAHRSGRSHLVHRIRPTGAGTITGRVVRVNGYPALLAGREPVPVVLLTLDDPDGAVVRLIDDWEGYDVPVSDAGEPSGASGYTRCPVVVVALPCHDGCVTTADVYQWASTDTSTDTPTPDTPARLGPLSS